VDVSGAKGGPFAIAVVVEAEQRMIAGGFKVD
jgi:hypothetical protein